MPAYMRGAMGVLLTVGLVVVATNLPAGDRPPVGEVKVGQEYFMRYCSACHGQDGRGHGPVARELRTPPADLTGIAARRDGNFPDAEIAAFIDGRTVIVAHGTREMPVWGERFHRELGGDTIAEEMTRGRLNVLVAFLKSIQTRTGSPAPPPE